jgi:L-histidine N-alpha-methyltransferase
MTPAQATADIIHARPGGQERALLAAEVRAGLTATPLPTLPSKCFYDDRGDALFDEITRLPEYYLTRTEEAMLPGVAREVAERLRPRHLVELGSGIGGKVRMLLDAMAAVGTLESCTLFDISAAALEGSIRQLRTERPRLRTLGVVGDFLTDLRAVGPGGSRLIAFLGSTIGNIPPAEVPPFFRAAAQVLAPGDGLLLGLDLVKDRARLEAAYNDSRGVTAEFNRNILRVVNAQLEADFDPDAFDHVAFYDAERAWIEMRLRARRPCRAHVAAAGVTLSLGAGDEIRTEISGKYTRETLRERLEGTGLLLDTWWTDPESLFALALLRRSG